MKLIPSMRMVKMTCRSMCILACSWLIGCGSIIHGSKQQISFDTKPQGAIVKLGNGVRLTTPQTVELRRADDHTDMIEKEGYEPERITIKRSFNAVATILGNILWLVPGVIVDVLVGGAWTLDPEHISVELVAEKSNVQAGHSSVGTN
jgi:hypothetical protein